MPATGPELTNKLGVELIRTGSWAVSTGRWDATPECLASAVEAQKCPAIRPPVLKLGHRDARFDGDPALGWVQDMRVTNGGKTLVGDFKGMPQALDQIMANAYPDRSVEGSYNFRCAAGHTHPFVLTAVALLGVTPPGIATLKSFRDVASLYGLAASAAPVLGGTPVVVTIRGGQQSPTSAPAVPSAPSQTRSAKPMTFADDRPRRTGESLTEWGVASGRIGPKIAADWDQKIAASAWSEDLVEKALNILKPGTARPLLSAMDATVKPAQATTWKKEKTGATVAASSSAPMPPPPATNPAYRRNPLIEDVQASGPYRHALTQGQPPTLFAAGDLPVYTASGIDPTALLNVPWIARHPIAAARTQAEALDLMEDVSGPDGESAAHVERMGDHYGNRDYQRRVDEWLNRGYSMAAAAAEDAESKKIAAAAGMAKSPAEMTEDELYEAAFAAIDRKDAERRAADDLAILEGRALGHGRDMAQVRASYQSNVAAAAGGTNSKAELWETHHPSATPVGRTPSNTSKSIDYSKVLGGDA